MRSCTQGPHWQPGELIPQVWPEAALGPADPAKLLIPILILSSFQGKEMDIPEQETPNQGRLLPTYDIKGQLLYQPVSFPWAALQEQGIPGSGPGIPLV